MDKTYFYNRNFVIRDTLEIESPKGVSMENEAFHITWGDIKTLLVKNTNAAKNSLILRL